MKGYIYKITSSKTSDFYVGSTIQELKTRFKTHRSNAKLGKPERLYESMRQHGIENFSIEILEEIEINSKSDLGRKETEYFQSLRPSLNMKAPNIIRDKENGRIYRLVYDLDATQFYIGSTQKTIQNRLSDHRSLSQTGSTPLYRFMRERGKENFSSECLEDGIPLDQLITRENHWISQLKPPLNKNTHLCMTEQERDRIKYLKNREKRLEQVNTRRLEKRDEINAQKREHYQANRDKFAEKDKEKRRALQEMREKEADLFVAHPGFTTESLQTKSVLELKETAKRLEMNRSPKTKPNLIEVILKQQAERFK